MSRPAVERFYLRVRKIPNGCWEWLGALEGKGYGTFHDGGRIRAHRWAYEHFIGPIPEHCVVMHSCDNPKCVNPEHLKAGRQYENIRDMWARGRGVCTDPEIVKDIVESRRAGERVVEIAERLGRTRQSIYDICMRFARGEILGLQQPIAHDVSCGGSRGV